MTTPYIILASSSATRKELLQRLELEFHCHQPDIDETSLPEETPQQLVIRLAQSKAQALCLSYPQNIIIGADTIAWHQNQIIGKPATHQQAVTQLLSFSNSEVSFFTGLSVLNTVSKHRQTIIEPYYVSFRPLTKKMVEDYVTRDQPYHCAGSIKAEGLASTLFKSMRGDDFSALLGLPLIQLTKLLESEGIDILGKSE